jgi:hypothetical protein
LWFAADIEGHVGTDGRFYLLDFARTMPPHAVTKADAPGSILYRLLRAEFVQRYPEALSPDAYSAMGRHDAAEHNARVRNASRVLLEEVTHRVRTCVACDSA